MTDWPTGKFGVVLADPPWTYRTWSEKNLQKSAKRHFSLMTLDDIKALPVADSCAIDCALFMWTPDAHLEQALSVIRAWGFQYKTVAFNWVKTTSGGRHFVGMGFWTRKNPEICLLATRGHPKRLSAREQELIVAPRREYARKPEESYTRIERLVAGPYLELFARETRPGWTGWGNEVSKFDEAAQ